MSAGSLSPTPTISGTLSRWQHLLTVLILLLALEAALAAVLRIHVIVQVLTGDRLFAFVEVASAVGLLMFPLMLYAIVRIRIAQHDLDLHVTSERESANATRVLLDTTTEGIYAIDRQGRCTMANRAAGESLGYVPEELIGRDMHELIHHTRADGSPCPAEDCPIFQAMSDGDPCAGDDELLWRKDGSSFSAAYSSAPIVNGDGVHGAVVSFKNIDERKSMEAALRDSEQQTRRFLEDLPLAVFIVDENGRPIYSNRASVQLLGVDTDPSLEGQELPDAYQIYTAGTNDPYEADRLPVLRALGGETVTVDDIEVHRPDGSVIPLEVWAGPIRDEEGTIRYAAAAFSDISARKELETAMRESAQAVRMASEVAESERAKAEEANRAKSEFLSRMSHELRTPLNAILGFAQLLEMDDLEAQQLESTEQIIKGGRRLLELINEVLDISRIESGRLALSLEPVLICDLIDECVRLIRPLADVRAVRVHSECTDVDQHVWADRHRLGQVLLNLLSNAVKYNAPEGTVTVTCSAAPDGKSLRVGVTDTGPGIPAEKVPLLFTPFERLGADASEVEGTGLGLVLSKSLVEAMGGRIFADTMKGLGTTFWIEVATAEQIEIEPFEETAGEGSALVDSYRVLYIEDNLANLKLIEKLLDRKARFEVISAMSGTLGLDLARQHLPDLILLDLGLPDLKGHEVLARLRKDPATADIPVVILSADATPGEIKRLLAAGAADYLTKPIDVSVFMRVLENVLATETASAGAHLVSPDEPARK